jgi:glycosyltransferase involved in cell wall biosynthesis
MTLSNNSDKSDIKLSIAIPTYNGSAYIQEALDSIISQLDEINEEIEIVISDNASTDRTSEIIKEYQKKKPYVKYFLNTENLGPDKNFDLAIRRSIGKHVWIFSDDDKFKPGSIKKVLDVTSKYPDLAAIFVNWSMYDDNMKKCITKHVFNKKKDIFYEDADDFLFDLTLGPVFISSDIFNRQLYENLNTDRYFGTFWGQYATMIEIIRGHNAYFISEPYVMRRSGDPKWDKTSQWRIDIIFTMLKTIRSFRVKGYGRKPINECKKIILRSLPQHIVEFKKCGIGIKKFRIKEMVSEFGLFSFFWIIILPMIMIPNRFYKAKIFKLLYRKYILLKGGLYA